jgi:hypothetical protein
MNGRSDQSAKLRVSVLMTVHNAARIWKRASLIAQSSSAWELIRMCGTLARSGRVFRGAKEACVALAVDEIGLFNNRITRSLFFR